MSADKEFGEMLREARKWSGLSAREAAERVGVSMTFIYDIEKCRKGATLETITKLADVYDSPELLEKYKENKNIPKIDITYRMMDVIRGFNDLEIKGEVISKDEEDYKKTKNLRNLIAHGRLEQILKTDPNVYDEIIEYLNRKLKDLAKEDGE